MQENKAKTTYLENKAKTDAHNLRYAQGLVSFDVGIHENSDLTFEELSRLRRPNIALQSLNFIRANREPVTEEQLKSVIDNNGIITATMDTADNSLFSYKSGVYSCENTELKLQMEFLIIDYGTENNIDYWLCQTR